MVDTVTATATTIINMLRQMIKVLSFSLLSMASLAGCTIVPGLDLSVDSARVGAPHELNGFDLIDVTPEVVVQLNEQPIPNHGVGQALNRSLLPLSEDQDNVDRSPGYRIGAGDILSIIVWDHPELTNPTGEFRDPESAGRLVDVDGRIFYPYIGTLSVEGFTVAEVREIIAEKLARVVRDPQVDVRVAGFRSQRVKVTGEVRQPDVLPITDRPLTLLEAIATVGGLTERANRRFAILSRSGVDYRVDLVRIGRSGQRESEVVLQGGDVLEVPRVDDQKVFLLGAVGAQSAIEMPLGTISLAEALSQAQGLDPARADKKKVFVIRAVLPSSGTGQPDAAASRVPRPTVYQFAFNDVAALLMSEQFQLWPRDVIYVDRTGLASYNTVIAQVLPTVSTLFQLDRLFLDE